MKTNVDLVLNGQTTGALARALMANGRTDVGVYKPFLNDKGIPCVSVFTGGNPKDKKNYRVIQVNAATLRRDEWKQLDDVVVKIAESRLNGIQDLISKGLTY